MSKSTTKTIFILLAIIGGIILTILGIKWLRKNRNIRDGATGEK